VVVFLLIVAKVQVNTWLIIGVFLLFAAAKRFSVKVYNAIKFFVGYEKIYFVVMGIIHRMTNLGVSLLTTIVHDPGRSGIVICDHCGLSNNDIINFRIQY